MPDTTKFDVDARWSTEQSEYLGLTLGMLHSKGVPLAKHERALEEILLGCWVSVKLGLIPASGLPDLYQETDTYRAAICNWFILLVDAWISLQRGPSPSEWRTGAFATAREVVSFVRNLSPEARTSLRRNAGIAAVN